MGDMQTQIDYPKNVTFEQVWAILQEVAERQKETDRLTQESAERRKETERLLQESAERRKETERLLQEVAESQKDTDRIVKEIGKRLGDFTNGFGDVIEAMITPGLLDKLGDVGLDFQTAAPNFEIRDHKNKIYFEIDALLENGDTAMLVEIKTNLTISHINQHINRLEKMRKYSDLRGDKRVFLGAVAGVVVPSEVKRYALENGFYMIEPSGESFNITAPHDKPREW